MSLDVLSEQTGVSKSMLAQIEKGTANPSLGVLGKITSGLRIEFQELIDAPPMESCLVTFFLSSFVCCYSSFGRNFRIFCIAA